MFSVPERSEIRSRLVERAAADPDIAGAALVASAARGTEDRWSDIDLVLQLRTGVAEPTVVDAWTRYLDRIVGVSDIHDVVAGSVRYRVFLLRSCLQVDVSFWPRDEFRATDTGFRLLFGTANEPADPRPADAGDTIGRGWLYALHARSAVARGRLWQAVTMLDELRNSRIALQCIRAGLDPWHGRGVDQLPPRERQDLETSRATQVTAASLDRSRIHLTRLLLAEIARHDADRSAGLRDPFAALAKPV
ncbi:hypothetical protein [Tersicoccus sp. Bi-70]|uniref:hypothetical protein n=1 Tax=Tersicoccus sp. Bi-70 TaxID=1897634 RepID=UPI000975AD41